MTLEFLMFQMIPDLLIGIPVRGILGQMKHMQPNLAGYIGHRPVRDVGRSLIHNNHQVPLAMMPQHLPQEANHFLRRDPLFVQLKDQPPTTIDRRHRRYPAALARDFLTRRLPTGCPGFAEKRRQGDIRLVLEIEQSLEFPHGLADFRGFDPHPLLTGFLVHLEVLALGLLIGQTGVAQTPPNRVLRERGFILLLNDLMHTANRPQVRLKAKPGCGLENDVPQRRIIEVCQQPRPATAHLSYQAILASGSVPNYPAKQRRAINLISRRHLADWQATGHSLNGSDSNLVSRVPSLAGRFHNRKLH